MELSHLRSFLLVADNGRFNLAAAALGVEASTVSRQISSLEDELGISLFERERAGRLRLTPGGEEVARHTQRVFYEIDVLSRIGRQFASGSSGEICLGIRIPPVGGSAQTLLSEWREQNPNIVLTFVEGNERELALALIDRRLDAALMAGHTTWPRVTAEVLFREPIVAVLPEGHPLASRSSVQWRSLAGETVLVQGWSDNHTQQEFYGTLLGNDVCFVEHAASKQTILGLVGASLGVTLANAGQAEVQFPGVVFVPIAEENAWIDFSLVWLPEIENPLIGRFTAFMRDRAKEASH